MTRRREPEPMTKVTMNFYERDYQRMKDLHPRIGATVAIRQLLRTYVMKVEAKAAAQSGNLIDQIEVEIDIGEEPNESAS